jgi:hypothetical protein
MTNQSARQASIRAVTGTTGTYNEDWLALFDLDGIPAGTFNERLYMWLEEQTGLAGLTLNELMVAYAVLQGVETWNELGTLTLTTDPLGASTLLLHPASDRGAEDDDLITNDPAPRVLVDAPAGAQVGNTLNFYVDSVEQTADALVLTQDDLDGLTEIGFSDLGVDATYGLQVSITNAGGESPLSNTVAVVVDTSLGACSVELTAGGLTTDDTTPELTVTFAGGVENDVAVIERASDGFVLGSKTLDGTDEIAGTAAMTLSELPEGANAIVAYVYGTATGSGAGTFTEAAEETLTVASEVLIIHDEYTGASGDDLNGRAPDTINIPGGAWVAVADGPEMNGSGELVFDAESQIAHIHAGITDNKLRAEEASNNTTRASVGILRDANNDNATKDGLYATRVGTTLLLDQFVVGSRTILYNEAAHFPDNGLHSYAVEFDGTDLKLYSDGVVVAAATQAGYSIPAGLDGNEYVGIETPAGGGDPSGTTRPYFKAWDLP